MDGPTLGNAERTLLRRSASALPALICLVLFASVSAWPTAAQTPSEGHGSADPNWFISMSLGDGQLKLQSDQRSSSRDPSFALGFDLGRRIGSRVRAGLEVNGWLLQAFDLNNPTVGESVGQVMAVGDFLPSRTHSIFARAGFGRSSYTINRPTGNNGGGMSWIAGGGYEIPVSKSVRLVPTVAYSAGNLGNSALTVSQTHLRYSVLEFKLAALYRFGH
ncbi:hypothetical protein [Occallatibacter savannae]|uniref:hypothetical protein n=1 Tax=Occallatibacter savannae TaxID=1002691 RepID=UPI000D688DD0|nr:hypothetical protein [Occallatibacter savannae]